MGTLEITNHPHLPEYVRIKIYKNMNSIKNWTGILFFTFFTLLSITANCQDSPDTDSPQSDSPTTEQEESGFGGFGSGSGGMGEWKTEPGDFSFDGVLLKLTPESAKSLADSTAVQAQQLNELYNQLEEIEEKLLAKKMEYQLAVESRLSVEELQQLTKLRLEKANETREPTIRSSLFLSGLLTIQQHRAQLQLLEGVSRDFKLPQQTNEDEEPAFVNHLGYMFHATPLKPAPELEAEVLSICLNPKNYKAYGGPKLCGGFHPDLCIDACNGIDSTQLMICFGCHEVILSDAGQSLKFEMDTESMQRLEALAKKLYVHRETKQP